MSFFILIVLRMREIRRMFLTDPHHSQDVNPDIIKQFLTESLLGPGCAN